MAPFPQNTVLIDSLCEGLKKRGWFTSNLLVPQSFCESLLNELIQRKDQNQFKKAAIGADQDKKIIHDVRGDSISWLDFENPAPGEAAFVPWFNALIAQLNQRLFFGITEAELHYAFYPPSSGYQKHLDVFQKKSQRVLSFVLYLNHNWQPANGGELVLFEEQNPEQIMATIEPRFGHCALFLSDSIYHQVNFTTAERFSVTGWLKKPI